MRYADVNNILLRLTLPEKLDAAASGEEFGRVLGGLFDALESAKDQDDE